MNIQNNTYTLSCSSSYANSIQIPLQYRWNQLINITASSSSSFKINILINGSVMGTFIGMPSQGIHLSLSYILRDTDMLQISASGTDNEFAYSNVNISTQIIESYPDTPAGRALFARGTT